eukprot:ANDGO_07419.mRNA.1 hypothetical protein
MSSSDPNDKIQELLKQFEQLKQAKEAAEAVAEHALKAKEIAEASAEHERKAKEIAEAVAEHERKAKEIVEAAAEHERLEKERERQEKESTQIALDRERQEKEAEHQGRLAAEEVAKVSDIKYFLSKLSQDLLALGSSSRSGTTNLYATRSSFDDLFPSISSNLPFWEDFQAMWNETVGTLPLDSCPEPLLQVQFRLFITRFLSKHGDMHLVDFSRSGLYGQNQRVDLLLCIGRLALRCPMYSGASIAGELKGSDRLDGTKKSKLSEATQQVYQRFAHIVQESGISRRVCWGFACNRKFIVFLCLRIFDSEFGWDYELLETEPIALHEDGMKGLCFLLSSDPHALCGWNGTPPPVISALSSGIVRSLSVSPRLELTGMLQRAPVHGIGKMNAVELATGTLDATNSIVAKCFPVSRLAEWTTELGALQELSRIDWGRHRFWVPTLLHSEQSDQGAILCTAPVGVPLPLASCYPNRSLAFCTELLQQLMSIVLQCDDRGIYHMDICPQNVVLLEEMQSDFQFPICLIDWGGASFIQKRDKKEFHYHAAFSPDWLDAVASLVVLSDGQRLQVCLQQAVLTTVYLAIGDILSWLPPVAIYLKESTLESHTRLHNKDELFEIRSGILNDVLNPSLPIPALDTEERRPLRSFLQRLHHEFPSLFELENRSSASDRLVRRVREFFETAGDQNNPV